MRPDNFCHSHAHESRAIHTVICELAVSRVCSRQKFKKTENSNLHGFEVHRPSSKGTKLLLQVIKSNHQSVNANINSDTLQTFAGAIDRQEHTDEGRRRRGSGGMGQVTPEQEKSGWWARVQGRDLVLGGLCHSPEDSLLLFFHFLEMHCILVRSTQALAWKERTVCHYTTFLHYTTSYGSACEG